MEKLSRLSALLLGIVILAAFFSDCRDSHVRVGEASWYHQKNPKKKTASGETYDPADLTAAHRRLPFQTKVKVIRTDNNKEVVVRINDRGPYWPGRIIDLSKAAANALGMVKEGVVPVRLQVLEGP